MTSEPTVAEAKCNFCRAPIESGKEGGAWVREGEGNVFWVLCLPCEAGLTGNHLRALQGLPPCCG